MKNAILVPGRPDKDLHYDPEFPNNSENYWFSWLKRQLIVEDIQADTIEPPLPFQPRYELWKKEFERFDIFPETILVGHSCGGGFLLRYLSENKDIKVGKVILVAPWINPFANPKSDTADFFEFDIDADMVSRTDGISIFISNDDDSSVVKTVKIVESKVKDLEIRRFADRGHFTTKTFPELTKSIKHMNELE